ncbi:MAG: glycosyltransferase family 39 protein [Phycisphaeraceae bacterium]|nr:glycosyltransferase family 39 protein [Phycisphaeraceae bacterium]
MSKGGGQGRSARWAWSRSAPVWAGLLIAVCLLVYGLWLGVPGFASSEGHRVVPGWTMARTGEWLKLEMFETPYLRKPPGMPWAIGASASVFGFNEWSARLPSLLAATIGVLACWWFATRWFGRGAGLAAGLAQALAPALWSWGRSAEIEMTCIVGAQVMGLGLVHTLVFREVGRDAPRAERSAFERLDAIAGPLAVGIGAFVAVIGKGSASGPVLAGVLGVCWWRSGLRSALTRQWALAALALGAGVAGVLWWRVWTRSYALGAVTEEGSFLWEKPLRTLMLIPAAWVAGLPASLALLPQALSASREEARAPSYWIAGTLTSAWLWALIVFTVTGVGNPRYALPAIGLLFPVAGFWAARAWSGEAADAIAERLTRALMLGRAWVLPVALLVGAVVSAYFYTHREESHVTRRVGERIAQIAAADLASETGSAGGVTVIADGAIEARPDVLLYAQHAAADDAIRLRALWRKPALSTGEDRGVVYLLLRAGEADEHVEQVGARLVETFRFGRYEAGLYRVGE